MAAGKPLTPKQVRTIKRVWLETANASEAARQAGCSEGAVRRHLGKKGRQPAENRTRRADLYARALDESERAYVDVVNAGRAKAAAKLDEAESVEDLTNIMRATHDGLRAITTTKMAHAKLSGALIEKHDVTSGGAALKLYLPDES